MARLVVYEEPRAASRCRVRLYSGFTLIELLVVISVIALLAAMLLPTLSRAKRRAQTIACLNNIKQLQICASLYAADSFDCLPPNNSIAALSDAIVAQGYSWCTNLARTHLTPEGIIYGVLYEYNTSLGIYRCPSDWSQVEDSSGEQLGIRRWRSYNLSQSINGAPQPVSWIGSYVPSFRKLSQINSPGPIDCLTFIEVHEDSIYDALFGIPPQAETGFIRVWWDVPASRHDQSAVVSFADGHAEAWRWRVPKKVHQPYATQMVPDEEAADYDRVQRAIRQSW